MRILALASIVATFIACARVSGSELSSRRGDEPTESTKASVQANAVGELAPGNYSPGRWRLARPHALFQVLIPVSHILVRHEGVQEGIVSFHLSDWTPSPPPPQRTREHARALAAQIADRLQKSPNDFASVARETSEDIATQSLGGTLGTIVAAELLPTPEVLDALIAIGAGEVSRPVETEYGFHVFQRRPPPAEQTVSGARILIGHDRAPWLGRFLAHRPLPARSRDEAMRLAHSIYERAKSGEPFDQLAREHSDHREALRGGDFGAWSTHESTPYRREIELLAGMEVGEVHSPIDSPFGVAILQRVANHPRRSFAMAAVKQRFDSQAPPTHPTSRDTVLKNIRALSDQIASDPSKFGELQKEHCCTKAEQWIEGRGEAEAEALLARLGPGEIGKEPVTLAGAFAIVKRLEPVPESVPALSFEWPVPAKPDISYFTSNGSLPTLLSGFAGESAPLLGLEPRIASQFVALLEQMRGELVPKQERTARFARLQAEVQTLIGTASFQLYLELLDAHVERELLQERQAPRIVSGAPVP